MQVASTAILALIAGAGCWLDLSSRRLPNWLCLAALLAGLGYAFLSGGRVDLALAAAHAAAALVVGMLLFAGKMLGGGDAKFYAALASWFPIQQALFLLVSVALSGFVLAVIVLIRSRRIARRPAFGIERQTDDEFRKVPYGVAIAAGAMISHAMLVA